MCIVLLSVFTAQLDFVVQISFIELATLCRMGIGVAISQVKVKFRNSISLVIVSSMVR